MNRTNKYILLVLIPILLLVIGCHMTYTVKGCVTFEDGTPLTIGTVVFESDSWSCKSELDSKGHYSMKGVPEETTFKVYILGAVKTKHRDNGDEDGAIDYLIAEKFRSPKTSGITCDVDTKNPGKRGGVITFNFTVSKPNDEQE